MGFLFVCLFFVLRLFRFFLYLVSSQLGSLTSILIGLGKNEFKVYQTNKSQQLPNAIQIHLGDEFCTSFCFLASL